MSNSRSPTSTTITRLGLYDTYTSTSSFLQSSFDISPKLLRGGLNLDEYEPHLNRKTIVRPAQNRPYSSNDRGRHPRGGLTGVGLARRWVSVPWGVKKINSLPYDAKRVKSLR